MPGIVAGRGSATVEQPLPWARWPRRAPGERPVTVNDDGAHSTAPAAWP